MKPSRRTVVVPDKMRGNTRAIYVGQQIAQLAVRPAGEELETFIAIQMNYGQTGRAVHYLSGKWTFMPDGHGDAEVNVNRKDLYFSK